VLKNKGQFQIMKIWDCPTHLGMEQYHAITLFNSTFWFISQLFQQIKALQTEDDDFHGHKFVI
jgi:hypothetical protein